MKIGFYAPPVEFANALFDEIKAKLADADWTRWQPGAPPPSTDVEVLLAMGPVTRELMERLPELVLIQTLSDGYESVDLNAATALGIRVSYSPGDLTGNADSVAEYTVLLMLATAPRLNHRLLTFGVNLTGVDLLPAHAPKYIPTVTPDRLKQAVANADYVVLSVRAMPDYTTSSMPG